MSNLKSFGIGLLFTALGAIGISSLQQTLNNGSKRLCEHIKEHTDTLAILTSNVLKSDKKLDQVQQHLNKLNLIFLIGTIAFGALFYKHVKNQKIQ